MISVYSSTIILEYPVNAFITLLRVQLKIIFDVAVKDAFYSYIPIILATSDNVGITRRFADASLMQQTVC